MIRWSIVHPPVQSTDFVMDRQFCRRDVDTGVKKDICKDSGGQGFGQDEDRVWDVCGWCGLQSDESVIHNLSWYTYWHNHNRDWQHWVYSIVLMTRSRTTLMVFSPPKCLNFLKQPGYQRFWNVLQTKAPDYHYSEFGWHTTWSITVGHRTCHRCSLMRKKRNRKPKFQCGLLLLKPTWSVESRDARMLL